MRKKIRLCLHRCVRFENASGITSNCFLNCVRRDTVNHIGTTTNWQISNCRLQLFNNDRRGTVRKYFSNNFLLHWIFHYGKSKVTIISIDWKNREWARILNREFSLVRRTTTVIITIYDSPGDYLHYDNNFVAFTANCNQRANSNYRYSRQILPSEVREFFVCRTSFLLGLTKRWTHSSNYYTVIDALFFFHNFRIEVKSNTRSFQVHNSIASPFRWTIPFITIDLDYQWSKYRGKCNHDYVSLLARMEYQIKELKHDRANSFLEVTCPD